jgi:hypothetical protein
MRTALFEKDARVEDYSEAGLQAEDDRQLRPLQVRQYDGQGNRNL